MASSQIHRLPSQSLSQLLSNNASKAPLSTSIQSFDDMLEGGFYPGQIYEICGIQGSGKSSLASQIVKSSLLQDKHVLWISSLQMIPMDIIEKYVGEESYKSLSNLHHIRLDSISLLFIFIQSLNLKPVKFSLIIIDDFASLISRCFDESKGSKHQSSHDHKKNKAIQSLLKLLSTYCAINNSICTIFNSSNILNMSFVETKSDQVSDSQQQMQPPSSSQSFMGSMIPRPKVKRLYQQVLVSPLGDHPIWSSYFKARLMLYKDWTSSSSINSTAIFVHFKQNRLQKHSNIEAKVVNFQETSNGIIEVGKRDTSMISNGSNSFTLAESDFGSDEEVDELRTTDLDNSSIVLLESSLRRHNDISTAKNILPDDLTNCGSNDGGIGQQDERMAVNEGNADSHKDTRPDNEEDSIQSEKTTDGDDNYDPCHGTEEERINEVHTSGDGDSGNDSSIEQLREDDFHEQTQYELRSFTIPNEPLPMTEDTSVEYEEIEDELEELYPTQPESLHVTQLSQIPSPPQKLASRRKFDPDNLSNNVKRLRLPLQDATNTYDDSYGSQLCPDEYIPASAPYF